MKKKVSLIAACALVVAFGGVAANPQHPSPAKAESLNDRPDAIQRQETQPQAQRQRQHEVVVLWAYQGGYATGSDKDYTYYYYGAQIYASSSSEGAPKFPQGSIPLRTNLTELAEGIALLLNQGYHIERASDNGQDYLLVK